jgi:endonuclease YncB( thermonuclease family)
VWLQKAGYKYVLLKNITTEKYGRILADVYLEDIHINKLMIDQNLAVKYDGGKKPQW